ncbi:hypothetical protein RR48_11771 [Papilio machaon]|uniref:Uncharacterized protein n=1 Tax=Papilio machaon TaxID=76193 RepID=A0A194QMZ4_PAPMA|nr:hypothetical protein RR48_11771 [Papilio machaon]
MEEVFQDLNRQFIRLKARDKKYNNIILHSVLEDIINRMRACDNLFDSMNPRLDYLGSYYDGLRVGEPNEYDINVILRIPIDDNKIILDARESECGHTCIILPSEFRRLAKTPATANKGYVKTLMWCDTKHRFSVTKFRSWIQSVVDTTLNTLPVKDEKRFINVNNICYFIESKRSGPAITINIIKCNNTVIDVDLVPTFAITLPKKPINSSISLTKVSATNIQQYFVVPKPTQNDFSWRLTFPIQERLLIRSKNNLKSTIRLLKYLRDVQGFKNLSSYYIKTLFLWEIVPENELMWKNKSLSFLVIYMLKKLRDCLMKGEIKNYWCPEHNLIEKIKKNTCQNWGNRLNLIVNALERKGKCNASIVLDYFTKNKKDPAG